MKTKLYVLVHINADSCRNKKVETKSFMSLEDARAEMKRQWDAELEQLNDPDYNYTVLGSEPLFHNGTAIELYLYNGSDYASFFFNPSCTIEFR